MGTENNLKHILFFNRSFWPDTEATGQFITELCTQLADKYKVTVVVGRSYYIKQDYFSPFSLYRKERLGEIAILRVRHTRFWKGDLAGRIINWLTYCLLAFLPALTIKADLVIVSTDPPFLGIMAMLLKKIKSTPFIYNCRDLYLDVALGIGKLKPGLIARIYDWLDKKAFNSARIVVPLGWSMGRRIVQKGIDKRRIKIISDWVDVNAIRPVSKDENPLSQKFGLKDKFVIMYSGNIGLTQNLDLVLKAAAMIGGHSPVFLVFAGEGAGKKDLIELARSLSVSNILFLPYQPMEMLSCSLGMADLHIISFQKGLSGAIVPSKVYGIMAAARPYLAIADEESEPARFAQDFKCGLWVPPGDVKVIAGAMQWACDHRIELAQMGSNARNVAEERFSRDIIIGEWFNLLNELTKDGEHTYS